MTVAQLFARLASELARHSTTEARLALTQVMQAWAMWQTQHNIKPLNEDNHAKK